MRTVLYTPLLLRTRETTHTLPHCYTLTYSTHIPSVDGYPLPYFTGWLTISVRTTLPYAHAHWTSAATAATHRTARFSLVMYCTIQQTLNSTRAYRDYLIGRIPCTAAALLPIHY